MNLAVLRIVTTAMVLLAPETRDAARWAAVDPALRTPPPGLAWVAEHLPASAALGGGLLLCLQASALLGLVGLATRPALTVATLSALALLGIPQLYGTVIHDHHLVWLLALLAASPSGHTLSLDSVLRARRGDAPETTEGVLAFAVPLLAAWLLVGIIFFFPGFWKLRTSGVAWFWSDNLRNQMYAKWLQADFVPAIRVDRFPWLCRLAALGVVLFELSFVALVWRRRWRMPLVACAIAFHTLTAYFMRVRFTSLWVTYAMFVDWGPILAYFAPRGVPGLAPARRARSRWPRAACAVAAVLVIGNLVAGFAGVVSWPFAVYPTFAATLGSEMPVLGLDAVLPDGTRVPIVEGRPAKRAPTPRMLGLAWSILADPSEPRVRAYLAEVTRAPDLAALLRGALVRGAREVELTRDVLSLDPDDHARPPLRRTVVARLRL